MADYRGADSGDRGKSISHGYKPKAKPKATTMDAQRTETNGYKPATSQVRPTPPKPPAGNGGGSK